MYYLARAKMDAVTPYKPSQRVKKTLWHLPGEAPLH